MATPPLRPGSAQNAALELFDSRRAALIERVALEMHDALVGDGVSFSSVRNDAAAWIEAVSSALAGRYAPSAVSELNQSTLRALDQGLSLATVVAGIQAALGAMIAVAGEHAPNAVGPISRAGGGLGGEVAATAARSLEERARMQLKRRADRADRFREAICEVAEASLDADGALHALTRAAVTSLDCDWAAVALREGDGTLTITALDGRGVGWAQRWSLSEHEGFCERVLRSGQAVTTADPDLIGYSGADRPAAIVAAPIRAGAEASGVLFAGRDHGPVPDEDDAVAASGLAEIGARALETAGRYREAQRSADQTEVLAEAARLAASGSDRSALALVARAAVAAAGADAALIRVLDDATADLVTRGVHARSAALAAELEGTRAAVGDDALSRLIAGEELLEGALTDVAVAGPCIERLGPVEAAGLPIMVEGRGAGALVVVRGSGNPFDASELDRLRTAVGHAAMLVLLDRVRHHVQRGAVAADAELERLGEALAAGADEHRVARLLARLAAEALEAERALLYRGSSIDDLDLVAGYGFRRDELAAAPGRALAADALARGEAIVTGGDAIGVAALAGAGGLPSVLSAPLVLRDIPVGALQLFFADRDAAQIALTQGLGAFAAQAAEALGRAGEARRRDEELRRMSALVQIAAQATASASLEQTLAAVGAHVATLSPGAQAAVYVIEEGRLVLSEPPSAVASTQGAAVATLVREDQTAPHLLVADARRDARLEALAGELAEDGAFRSLVVAPLRFREALIGALALSALEPGAFSERDVAELRRQSPPIVLAIESAILASHSLRLEQELSSALAAERSARGELDAQDAVVRAVAEGWDRERASSAVARAVAELLDADAAAVLVPAAKGGFDVDALYVSSPALDEPIRRILRYAPGFVPPELRAELTAGRSQIVEGKAVEAGSLLGPLLAPGSSAGFVPLRDGETVTAVLVAVSLDPARPIDEQRLQRAERFAPQAALAVRA